MGVNVDGITQEGRQYYAQLLKKLQNVLDAIDLDLPEQAEFEVFEAYHEAKNLHTLVDQLVGLVETLVCQIDEKEDAYEVGWQACYEHIMRQLSPEMRVTLKHLLET